MRCAWHELLRLLPTWMRADVDGIGCDTLQELRLRNSLPPELVLDNRCVWLNQNVSTDDISYVINTASQYSPWASETISKGYLTPPGGHRIGVCGEAVVHKGEMTGVRRVTSLCIRVARDFPGIAREAADSGSVLVIGAPGSGKTTFLRDLIRHRSEQGSVAVVDERGELFPLGFSTGQRVDVLQNCMKSQGIPALMRAMCPSCIAVDEITEEDDCNAFIQAAWCGVDLLATAHAENRRDLLRRPVYQPLVRSGLFETLIVMRKDKSWTAERM